MTSLHKIHQLRCRYAHEIQQQQLQQQEQQEFQQQQKQQEQEDTQPQSVGNLRTRIQNSLLEAREFRATAEASAAAADRRSQEAKELLQQRLERFFNSLPMPASHPVEGRPATERPPSGAAAAKVAPTPPPTQPRGRPPRGRGSFAVGARRQTTIADQLNTNSSVVAMVSNLPVAVWPNGDEYANTLSVTMSTNSLDMTEVSDITVRDISQTCGSPPRVSAHPQPRPPTPRAPPPPQLPQLQKPMSPQLPRQLPQQLPQLQQHHLHHQQQPQQLPQLQQHHLHHQQQHQQLPQLQQHHLHHQQQLHRQPHQSRMRSSSLANLLDHRDSGHRTPAAQDSATAAATSIESTSRRSRPAGDFADHMRHLLDDFHSAAVVGGGIGVAQSASAASLIQQPAAATAATVTSPVQQPLTQPSATPRRGRCDRREVRTSTSGGRRLPVPKPRSASAGCRSGGGGDRSVCQVFQVTDVDAVRATLVTRDDRRVVKILGQFDCKAEVIDTVPMSPSRLAYIVCVAAPNVDHLRWCIGRIEDVFPNWELKAQMRGYKSGGC